GITATTERAATETKEVYNLKLTETEDNNTPTQQEPKAETHNTTALQLTIKNETPQQTQPATAEMKIGERVLTPEEIEEKQRFEEQKKALEERAERLRRMSFNIRDKEQQEDMENVPAYVRKNMNLDDNGSSSDTFYSGYSVGFQDDRQQEQASIQTINTFLDGKKPD